MKRFLTAALALLLVAAPALATVRTCFTNADLIAANIAAQPGDIILLHPLAGGATYSEPPQSWACGTQTQQIKYLGSSGTLDSVKVISPRNYGTTFPSFTTWQGLHFTGTGFDMNQNALNVAGYGCGYTIPKRDSLAYCLIDNGLSMHGVDSCTVAWNEIGNNALQVGFSIKSYETGPYRGGRGNVLNDNHMNLRGTENYYLFTGDGEYGTAGQDSTVKHAAMVRFNQFNRNRVSMVFYDGSGCTGATQYGLYLKYFAFNELVDNKFFVVDSTTGSCAGIHAAYLIRDLSGGNVWTRDTLLVNEPISTASQQRYYLSTSGNQVGYFGNKWDRCVFKNFGNRAADPGIFWQYGIAGDIVRNCIFETDSGLVSTGGMFTHADVPHYFSGETPSAWDYEVYAPYKDDGVTKNTCADIRNNTFFANKPLGGSGAWMTAATGTFRSWDCTPVLRNNIFYTKGGNAIARSVTWIAQSPLSIQLDSDYNLYSTMDQATQQIAATDADGIAKVFKPGTGTTWCSINLRDCNSKYGSALFTDSSATAFDPTLTAGSKAIANGENGVDIGAITYTTTPSDSIRPAALYDLQAVAFDEHTIRLRWTSVGDDSLTGTATAYDVRRSTINPITGGNFSSATSIAQSLVPLVAGSYSVFDVTGLTTNTTYYFAIKARDELTTHWSAISNVVYAVPISQGGGPRGVIDE